MTQKLVKNPSVPIRSNKNDSKEPFFSREGEEHSGQQDSPAFFSPRVQRKSAEAETDDPLEKEADPVPDTGWKSFSVQIPPGTTSKQEFHRYAELVIFHKVLNLDWQGTGTDEIYQNIRKHIGRTIVFRIPKSLLRQHGVAEKEDAPPDAKYLEIAALLKQFSDADYEDYQHKVNAETSDPDALYRSLAAYMADREERRRTGQERESIKTKLFGMEELYKRYKEFKKGENMSAAIEYNSVYDPLYDHLIEEERKERERLTASLKAYGFSSLEEFGKYIDNYEAAFRKETIAIAGDHLQRYRHTLFEEEKKLTDDAYVSKLFAEISRSGASKQFDTADSKGMEAAMALGTQEFVSEERLQRQMKLNDEASAAHAAGTQAMLQLPSASPLMKENTFSNENLSRVKSKEELKQFLQKYIDRKKESIDETWEDINANPERVYELDQLISASIQMQGITDNSIYDLIIKDKRRELGTAKVLKAVCFIVIGIALAVASFGTGIPALLAAGGSVLLSVYAVSEEIEKYNLDASAHDVGVLTKEPTLTWVVVSIIGAGADAAALAAAFRAAGPIAKATAAFNETKDVAALEKTLAQLVEVDAKIKQNIIRAAKTEAALQESVQKALAIGRRLNDITSTVEALPRLTVIAYHAIKKGVISFEKFLLELKLKTLINEISELTPEQLTLLKQAFEKAGKATDDEIKALNKLVERADLTVSNRKLAVELMESVRSKGKFKKASKYHGDERHSMTDDVVQNIIAHPEAVFETQNGTRLIYLKDGNVAVLESTKSAWGNAITAYGKAGKKGESGAKALGGLATDQGEAITELMILQGRIPDGRGNFIHPATKIYP